jgi:SAM-dependent methyltransferase
MADHARRQTAETVREDFDRIALLPDEGWSHNRHYQRILLRHAPPGAARALDAGCGTGELARLLADRCRHVTGLDLSPNMVAQARLRSEGIHNVEYAVGDVLTAPLPAGAFDVVASVAVLHHLPLEPVLVRVRDLLRPGGLLLVLDLRATELPADLAAVVVNAALRAWHTGWRRQTAAERDAWAAHGSTDRYLSVAEVREVSRRVLPGARVRWHLLWRYSLIWRAP